MQAAIISVAALFFTGVWVVSGSALVNIIILIAVSAVVWLAASKNKVMLNTTLTAIMVILIEY